MSKIAIIGASYLQLPAVKKAKEMGHDVICFAWSEGAVCKNYANRFYPVSITDKERILKICKEENIDAITSVASDLAVCTVNYVAFNMGLISNPLEWTDVTTNKFRMRECFKMNGIPSPRYIMVCRNYLYNNVLPPLLLSSLQIGLVAGEFIRLQIFQPCPRLLTRRWRRVFQRRF